MRRRSFFVLENLYTKANKLGDLGVWSGISAGRYGVVFSFEDIFGMKVKKFIVFS